MFDRFRSSDRPGAPRSGAYDLLVRHEVLIEIVLVGLLYLLWQTAITYPLRILVVFLHELSHAVATWLTGGRVLEFDVVARGGGHVLSQGGNLFLIFTAGYLGSLLWGVAFYVAARQTRADRALLGAIGAVLLIIAVYYGFGSFLMLYGVVFGLILLAIAIKLPNIVSDILLRVIGLTSMIYVPLDIVSDTILRPGLPSDAALLGQHFFGGAMFWGGLWLVISLAVIFWVLRKSWLSGRRPAGG